MMGPKNRTIPGIGTSTLKLSNVLGTSKKGFIRRKRTSASPQGSTGASSLFIDVPKPLDFFELRPSGNREEAP
ncbi:MAG: hypothetical protein ABIK89_02300, partial [Planctomycetota bacterium]